MNLSEHLLKSSYREIVQYCRVNPAAREICKNPGCGATQALFDFNIPLEYAPRARLHLRDTLFSTKSIREDLTHSY